MGQLLEVSCSAFYGFTLAEILITLCIIGVVAALTIPALMTKIQQSILQQQFNSAYAKLTQAVKMIEAKEGSVPYCNGWDTQCPEFYSQLAKQLKVVQYCPNKAYESGCIPLWHGIDDFKVLTEEQKQNILYNMPSYSTNHILNSNEAYVFIDGGILMPYNNMLNAFIFNINGKKVQINGDMISFLFVLSQTVKIVQK